MNYLAFGTILALSLSVSYGSVIRNKLEGVAGDRTEDKIGLRRFEGWTTRFPGVGSTQHRLPKVSRSSFERTAAILESVINISRGGASESSTYAQDATPVPPTGLPESHNHQQSTTDAEKGETNPPSPPSPPSSSQASPIPPPSRSSYGIFGMLSIKNLFYRLLSSVMTDPDILRVTAQILSTIVWISVILSVLGTCGVDTKPLLSVVGLSGLIFGIPLKDLLADMYAGIFILVMHPFKRGDLIEVNGMKGRVLSINIRYLKLLSTTDASAGTGNVQIMIPLSTVYRSAIKVSK